MQHCELTMARRGRFGLHGLFSLLLLASVEAFYIPGWSIKSYKDGESIPLMVNKAYSDRTQLQYEYYDLPFTCPPSDKKKSVGGLLGGQSISLNLGEVLRGDRIMTSDFELKMGVEKKCQKLCDRDMMLRDVVWSRILVEQEYVMEWIVDNLPGATSYTDDENNKYYAAGFAIGYGKAVTRNVLGEEVPEMDFYLNNHYTIVIRYRAAEGAAGERGEKVIVAFEVYPKSVGKSVKREEDDCEADKEGITDHLSLDGYTFGSGRFVDTFPITYSVYFKEDETIEWGHRWDRYFANQEEGSHIHWMAIMNSLIICGVLTGIVTIILTRTIRTDIKGHNERVAEGGSIRMRRQRRPSGDGAPGILAPGSDTDDEDEDDFSDEGEALEDVTGWKLLHSDVFRKPSYGFLLAPLVGSGTQLLFMAISLIVLSAVGVLNPSYRGGFLSVGVGLFIFAGIFSGYCSARVFKSFDGKDYRVNALVTGLLFPGLLFVFIFILNLFVWAQASSTAIPFTTLLAMLFLCIGIQLPLVYVGSHYGYAKAGAWEHPTKTSSVPRQVPHQSWYAKSIQAILLASLVPFAVIFIELLFVFRSVWQDKSGYYYLFGFLAVVSFILMVTVAEVTVVTIYVQLCSENHHWWWQSFLVGGGSAVWVFFYSVYYYLFQLHITGFVSSVLFFSYSFIACCVYGLLTGTIGFLSAYAFVRRIYSAIKID